MVELMIWCRVKGSAERCPDCGEWIWPHLECYELRVGDRGKVVCLSCGVGFVKKVVALGQDRMSSSAAGVCVGVGDG